MQGVEREDEFINTFVGSDLDDDADIIAGIKK
jgi:hypothetical protein